jgi:hypothetical protein
MDDRLASDLVAMWQSELAAMAADRELRETWTALLALWASTANAAFPVLTRLPHDLPPGSAGPTQPAGTAPAAPASDIGLDEINRLGRRIDQLEQRLAKLTARRPRNKRPGG